MRSLFKIRAVAALALAAVLISSVSNGWTAGVPKTVVPVTTYDFGAVKQGEKISHCFDVQNHGTAPLKIQKMELNYPDMTTRASGSIAPGKSGKVCVDLGTKHLTLRIKPVAVVFTNDPERPQFSLTLNGVVHAPIDLLPLGAVLASVWKGEGGQSTVTIVNNRPKALSIHGIEMKGQHFTARIETEKPGQVYKLVVTIPASLAPGLYHGTVYVNTDSKRYRRIRVPINILVKNQIYTFPLSLNFGSISLGQLNSGQISVGDLALWFLVKKRSGKFRIESIKSANPALEITQTPKGESDTFRINVTVRKGYLQPGPLSSVIRVRTNDPAVPEVSMPVTGQITE